MAFSRLTTNTTTVGSSYFLTGGQGASLASASTITVTDSFHAVTGSTTINTINGGVAGMGLWLLREAGETWALGSSGNIKASASTPVDRAILLVTPDGTTWYGQADFPSVVSANTDITATESGGTTTLTFNPSNVSLDEFAGPVGIAKGGTGQTTATAAFDALAPTTTAGDTMYHNGTDNVRLAKGTANYDYRMNSGATAPSWVEAPPDSVPVVLGSADATKKLRFEVDGFTTATTRVLTPPNADGTIAVLGTAQTFSAAQTFSGNAIVGTTGTAIKAIWAGSTTHDFGTISGDSSASTTVTITGAAAGDIVVVVTDDTAAANATICLTGSVTSANTVTLRCRNTSASNASPGSRAYYVLVFDIT